MIYTRQKNHQLKDHSHLPFSSICCKHSDTLDWTITKTRKIFLKKYMYFFIFPNHAKNNWYVWDNGLQFTNNKYKNTSDSKCYKKVGNSSTLYSWLAIIHWDESLNILHSLWTKLKRTGKSFRGMHKLKQPYDASKL